MLFDFKLMFDTAREDGLHTMWPHIKDDPFKKFGIRIDKSKYPVTKKSEEIYDFFMFVKLLPTPRNSFDKAVKSILVFSEVNPNKYSGISAKLKIYISGRK